MKPQDFRQLLLKPGTLLGLYGDDCGSGWTELGLVKCTLKSYVVVERHHNFGVKSDAILWDAAAIVSLFNPVDTQDYSGNTYFGSELLLIQRSGYSNAWDNRDPDVHVFGIRQGEMLSESPVAKNTWQPKTQWLACAAIMTVEEPSMRSEVSLILENRAKQKLNDQK